MGSSSSAGCSTRPRIAELRLLADRPVLGRKRLSQMPTDSIYQNLYDLSKAGYPPIRNSFSAGNGSNQPPHPFRPKGAPLEV